MTPGVWSRFVGLTPVKRPSKWELEEVVNAILYVLKNGCDWRDAPQGFDLHVTGVGTGGHITAVTEVLKPHFPRMLTFAVEPELSPVISGGAAGPHPLQGIGAGFVPDNLHREVLDGVVLVGRDAAYDYARRAAREEGILVGPSSGASLAAVAQKLPEVPENGRVLTFCYDTGERYLSVEGLFV